MLTFLEVLLLWVIIDRSGKNLFQGLFFKVRAGCARFIVYSEFSVVSKEKSFHLGQLYLHESLQDSLISQNTDDIKLLSYSLLTSLVEIPSIFLTFIEEGLVYFFSTLYFSNCSSLKRIKDQLFRPAFSCRFVEHEDFAD